MKNGTWCSKTHPFSCIFVKKTYPFSCFFCQNHTLDIGSPGQVQSRAFPDQTNGALLFFTYRWSVIVNGFENIREGLQRKANDFDGRPYDDYYAFQAICPQENMGKPKKFKRTFIWIPKECVALESEQCERKSKPTHKTAPLFLYNPIKTTKHSFHYGQRLIQSTPHSFGFYHPTLN